MCPMLGGGKRLAPHHEGVHTKWQNYEEAGESLEDEEVWGGQVLSQKKLVEEKKLASRGEGHQYLGKLIGRWNSF